MKSTFNPEYITKKEVIENCVINYYNLGTFIYEGNRNSIKIFDLQDSTICIKAFKKPHLFNKIMYTYFRKSKAKRSFEYAKLLLEKGIGTPKPIAYYENFDGLGLNDSYYVSEFLKSDFRYRELLKMEDEVKKETVLLREGERCQYMYFIKRGAMMGQTIHQQKEIVTYISIDNEFVSSISGLHGVVPSQEAIIAVEDSELIAMHNADLQELFSKYFDMNYLFRVMVEQYYRDAQERTHIIRVGNAKERYLYFVNTKPGYIERLPLHLVASMLDMKLQTLLRVQKQHQLSLQKDRETEDWCAKIEDYIIAQEAFKTTDLSLEKIAFTLSSSTHKLSAIFNNVYKMTFADFVNRQRIKSIQLQMADTEAMRNFTIEALARQTGFASRSAFYNAFKKIVGVSPAEYRSALSSSSI